MANTPKMSIMSKVDVYEFASVVNYLKAKGLPPKSQSGAIRSAVSILCKSMDDKHKVTKADDVKELMKSIGIPFNRDIADQTVDIRVNLD